MVETPRDIASYPLYLATTSSRANHSVYCPAPAVIFSACIRQSRDKWIDHRQNQLRLPFEPASQMCCIISDEPITDESGRYYTAYGEGTLCSPTLGAPSSLSDRTSQVPDRYDGERVGELSLRGANGCSVDGSLCELSLVLLLVPRPVPPLDMVSEAIHQRALTPSAVA